MEKKNMTKYWFIKIIVAIGVIIDVRASKNDFQISVIDINDNLFPLLESNGRKMLHDILHSSRANVTWAIEDGKVTYLDSDGNNAFHKIDDIRRRCQNALLDTLITDQIMDLPQYTAAPQRQDIIGKYKMILDLLNSADRSTTITDVLVFMKSACRIMLKKHEF